MSVILTNAAWVHPSLRFSPRGNWRLGARFSPWTLLHWLLLGRDGALVCRRRHESLLDRCSFGIGVGRKGGAAWSACPANRRDCLYGGRSLAADPELLIKCPNRPKRQLQCPRNRAISRCSRFPSGSGSVFVFMANGVAPARNSQVAHHRRVVR